jgi:hypothetical protein
VCSVDIVKAQRRPHDSNQKKKFFLVFILFLECGGMD